MEIRPLRWSDFESWTALYMDRYEEVRTNPALGVYTFPVAPPTSGQAEYFSGVFAGVIEGETICTVAAEGDRIVGHASVFPKGEYAEIQHIGSLGMIVHPMWRGRGIGDALLRRTLDDCRGVFEIIELAVVEGNEPALRLYRRHGFEERGRLPRSFKRGARYRDEIVMSRPIDGAAPPLEARADPG